MVLVMTTAFIPYGKEKTMGQRYIEVMKKYPIDRSLEKTLVPIGVKATKKGIKVISITDVKKGRYEDLIKRITEMNLTYSDIEGYCYKIETFLSGIDAMPMVGLMMPDI